MSSLGHRLGRGGLVVRSRLRSRRASGSKSDSTEDPPCMWACCTPNPTPWIKRPLNGVVPVQGSSSTSGSKLQESSQISPRVASKRKFNGKPGVYGAHLFLANFSWRNFICRRQIILWICSALFIALLGMRHLKSRD
ncbi:hypothetical protein AVEN_8613-1 [Araneus ventricosus]|uniref:Uncharacterized protein n=1 Tax=Araneus ventricosus TaxID=182803 RepID=A0A4Y2C3J7_ARAVE|nr:hypothetical protein AVEN_8613-1 [Araneus ventricosus]